MTLTLPAELTIYTAAETRSRWTAWFADNATLLDVALTLPAVDASRVDTVDGAGMQLLASLARTLNQRGLALVLSNPTDTVTQACEVLGVSKLIEVRT